MNTFVSVTTKRFFVLALLLPLAQMSAFAGYRTQPDVSAAKKDAGVSREIFKKPIAPQGGWASAEVIDKGELLILENKEGCFASRNLEKLQEVTISLTKTNLTAGSRVFAYVVHGGRINGQIATMLTAEEGGLIVFQFKSGPYSGNYPIVLRHAGKEEVIEFWVKPEMLKATEVGQ